MNLSQIATFALVIAALLSLCAVFGNQAALSQTRSFNFHHVPLVKLLRSAESLALVALVGFIAMTFAQSPLMGIGLAVLGLFVSTLVLPDTNASPTPAGLARVVVPTVAFVFAAAHSGLASPLELSPVAIGAAVLTAALELTNTELRFRKDMASLYG